MRALGRSATEERNSTVGHVCVVFDSWVTDRFLYLGNMYQLHWRFLGYGKTVSVANNTVSQSLIGNNWDHMCFGIQNFANFQKSNTGLYTGYYVTFPGDLDDWLTVHHSITLVDFQLDAQNSYLFTYNTFIKILYVFRALPCSSSGGLRRNCIYAASGIVTLCR